MGQVQSFSSERENYNVYNPVIFRIYGRIFEPVYDELNDRPKFTTHNHMNTLEDDYPLHTISADLSLNPAISQNQKEVSTSLFPAQHNAAYMKKLSEFSGRYPSLEVSSSQCDVFRNNLMECYKVESEVTRCGEALSGYSKCVRSQSPTHMAVA